MRISLVWLVVGLVVGVFGTRMVDAFAKRDDALKNETQTHQVTEKPEVGRLKSGPVDLSLEPKMVSAPVGDNIAVLKALSSLSKKRLLSYNVQVFDNKKKLTPQALELFQISNSEASAIEALLSDVERQITEIEVNTATAVLDSEKKTLVITVPPFPDRGGKIYDEVCRRMIDIVGAERGALLLETSRMEDQYTQFGVGVREITIRKKAAAGGHGIEVSDKETTDLREIAGEMRYGSSGTSGSSYPDRESLIQSLGPLAQKFVPAGF